MIERQMLSKLTRGVAAVAVSFAMIPLLDRIHIGEDDDS